MGLLDFWGGNEYVGHSEAVIVSCFFNPLRSEYRLRAFERFYGSIKHLNHAIVECVIGDGVAQLPESRSIERVYTKSLLWHKEGLLNRVIEGLPSKYRYVFWVDADVLFTNRRWLVEGVKVLKRDKIVQPFEFCVHLERDEVQPGFDVELFRPYCNDALLRNPRLWRSFGASHGMGLSSNLDYAVHGHVGFAWGARREVLERVGLFDRALIGGADHVMAHAAVGQIPHGCIQRTFSERLDEVVDWSRRFYGETEGRLGYVKGDLWHLWHGDVEKRRYFERIRDFTGRSREIVERDESGLFVSERDDDYMVDYFRGREVVESDEVSEQAVEPMTDSVVDAMPLQSVEPTIFFS